MITFVHITDTGNVGDLASGPYNWFDFGEHRVVNHSDEIPPSRAVIYGGGTLTGWLRGRTLPDAKRIAWGIGSTRHGQTEPWPDPEGFDLVGVREWSPEREGGYVPCASCMSPLFDESYPVTRDAVLFVNAGIQSRYPVAVGGLPTMDNTRPLEEIIPFLASAETVVTDSYHGAYWATLLCRRVVCLPYSSKFHGFKFPPVYSANRGLDWRAREVKAWVYTDALEDCRAVNRAFYERVMELIG